MRSEEGAAGGPAALYSRGVEPPRRGVPAEATDCHMHVFDRRYPVRPGTMQPSGDALMGDYRTLRERLKVSRCVIVQPSAYGHDNRVVLSALREMGNEARAVVVVSSDLARRTAREWQALGVRGIRVNLVQKGATSVDELRGLASLAADVGWHIELNIKAQDLEDQAALLGSLPGRVVFDHAAHLAAVAEGDRAEHAVRRMLQDGRFWIKFTAAYVTHADRRKLAARTIDIGRKILADAAGRVVWGSDWPHLGAQESPDDAWNLDLFGAFATREEWLGVLAENPAALYGPWDG